MIRPLLVVGLSLLLAPLVAAQPDQPVQADPQPQEGGAPLQFRPDTPENAVRYFVQLASYGSELDLATMVAGVPVGYFGSDVWAETLHKGYPSNVLSGRQIDTVNVVQKDGDDSVTVAVTMHSQAQDVHGQIIRGEPQKYTLRLRRETVALAPMLGAAKTIWRVVPPPIEDVVAKPLDQTPPLELAAALATHDPRLLPLLQPDGVNPQERATNQLKQLGLGASQFVQDYELIFAFDDAAHERALRPYLKKDSLYTIAGTKSEKWHFNDNLSTLSLAKLNDFSKVVEFYDGDAPDSEHLNFRFDGKTLIGFADGHVKSLSKEEAQNLLWKP